MCDRSATGPWASFEQVDDSASWSMVSLGDYAVDDDKQGAVVGAEVEDFWGDSGVF